MISIGDKVEVMYPYDASWWETKGVVVELENEDRCKVQDFRGNLVSIPMEYLKIT